MVDFVADTLYRVLSWGGGGIRSGQHVNYALDFVPDAPSRGCESSPHCTHRAVEDGTLVRTSYVKQGKEPEKLRMEWSPADLDCLATVIQGTERWEHCGIVS